MNGTFNGQILVDKLAKLNSSQQSIETLSHWCIFHMNNAKQVVEIWNRQFHCSPREQRLSFLYLANDILQNSRRKGAEFGSEFWKVLPGALGDVIENGDAPGKSAALRLVDIWDERKVFGTRGKLLKEGIAGRNLENTNKKEKASCLKLKQSVGNILEKIISSYEVVYDGPIEETSLFSKCKSAMDGIDKIDKEIGNDCSSGQLNGSEYVELQGQNGILRDCIEQLRASESSRATLVSHLKEALQEQEFKLGEVRAQLQVAQSKSEKAGNISQQLVNLKGGEQHNNRSTEEQTTFVSAAPIDTPPEKEQSAPVMYTQRGPYVEDMDPRKSAAAAVAAKLAASTSSAQMLTYVLSSLASERVMDSLSEYPSEKRAKHDNGSGQQHQPPLPPFPHPDLTQPKPPPPSSSPLGSTMQQQSPVRPQQLPLQPPSTQFMPTTGPYTYSPLQQPLQQAPPFTSYPMAGPSHSGAPGYPSPAPYQTYHGPAEGGFFNQPPMPASSPPMSRH